MNYEIKDTTVYGKVLAQKGKPVITNYDNAMKLAERFRGTLQKTLDKRYMIKLPETATTIEECDCQSQPTGEPMPQTYNQYPDHEVQMARQELYRSAKLALMIHDLLKNVGENQGLEGWVQRKITRAADYIESVFDYLDYEMRYPSEMTEAETMQVTPQNPNQPKTGAAKKPPGLTQTPGMVKMAKIDANGNVQGVPVMVPAAQVKSKQQSGFHVIGESASAGASIAGGIAAVATPMGGTISRSGVGSLFGGTYKQKKSKKKVKEGVEEKYKVTYDIYGSNKKKPLYTKTRTVLATSEQDAVNYLRKLVGGTNHRVEKVTETGPKFTGYWKGTDKDTPGDKMVGGE